MEVLIVFVLLQVQSRGKRGRADGLRTDDGKSALPAKTERAQGAPFRGGPPQKGADAPEAQAKIPTQIPGRDRSRRRGGRGCRGRELGRTPGRPRPLLPDLSAH